MGTKSSKITAKNNRSDGHLLEYLRSTFVRGGGGTNSPGGNVTASGGVKIVDSGNDYTYHVFITPGPFNVLAAPEFSSFDMLLVAGGGGGGSGTTQGAGGGGAGGVVHATGVKLGAAEYSINVGVGQSNRGGTGPFSPPQPSTYNRATPSYISGGDIGIGFTAFRGGGGGGYPSVADPGGSGGGAGRGDPDPFPSTGGVSIQVSYPHPTGIATGYGNAGGSTPDSGLYSAGGGGAGGSGSSRPTSCTPVPGFCRRAPGGNGRAFPDYAAPIIAPAIPAPERTAFETAVGPTGLYAGGGGGFYPDAAGFSANGGSGGGGGVWFNVPSVPPADALLAFGTKYTGSGGGILDSIPVQGYFAYSGPGGDGIVIIRYATNVIG